ncbi:MAG: M20/M25/M40 family metallo-hydrolase [Acidobacteriaceae bacterium]
MKIKPSIITRVLDLAVQIQQIPAPTFEEHKRAEFMRECFAQLGGADIEVDAVGIVYAHIRGSGKKPPVVVSAHLDTVFPASIELITRRNEGRIYGPGIGDNSLGLAGLVGILLALHGPGSRGGKEPALAGDVWLVANVGEEGLGNLKGMKAVVERFQGEVQAYIVLEGMSLGYIYHRGLSVRRYRISAHTKGGHAWVDFGRPSAIHELAKVVVKVNEIILPQEPKSSFNVGMISGGISINTIAAEAHLELDLRSESSQVLEGMSEQVEALVDQANLWGGKGVRVDAEVIGERPGGQISPDHRLVRLARECLAKNGIQARRNVGSTDANEPLSRGLPAICIGLTNGGGVHTDEEYIVIEPVQHGLGAAVDLIEALFRGNG